MRRDRKLISVSNEIQKAPWNNKREQERKMMTIGECILQSCSDGHRRAQSVLGGHPTWWMSKSHKLSEQIYGDDYAVADRVRRKGSCFRLSIYYSTSNDWVGMS